MRRGERNNSADSQPSEEGEAGVLEQIPVQPLVQSMESHRDAEMPVVGAGAAQRRL